jgi:hypothetical protein
MPKEIRDKIKAEQTAKRNKTAISLRKRRRNARLMEISLRLKGLLRHNGKLPRYDGPKRVLRKTLKAQHQLHNKASQFSRRSEAALAP